ncbi:hypothetical protein EQ832_00040 [Pseudomonas sp. ALS1131]|nr:TniQ family protein [Pseudomonas sp. ALS1131]TRO41440.1 hypothetical protein EQ832_00040 [Pseudomonas sp. ALS1131]
MMQIQLEPFADEALHSYLLRLAQGYGLEGSKQLLRAVNLKPRLCYDQQQLEALGEEFHLSLNVLMAMSPSHGAKTPILDMNYQRSGCSPICPCCIREAPYVRAVWDHQLVTACPQHGVLLMDECPGCSEPITRDRKSITHCLNCNFPFSDTTSSSAEDFDLAISALIAGTVSKARGLMPEALQSGSPPPDIADFLMYLAVYIQPIAASRRTGKAPRPKTVEESRELLRRAWSALQDWPTGIERFIESRICEGKGRSVHQRLGRWLSVFQKQFDWDTYSFFAVVVEQVLRDKFDGHSERFLRRNQLELTKGKRWYSAAEAASLLNSTTSLVVAAVENGRLEGRIEMQGNSRFVALHWDVIEGIRIARSQHLTQTEARKRLGVSKLMLDRLVEAGALQALNKDDLPALVVSGSFRSSDIDGLINRLKSSAKSSPAAPECTVGLQDISIKSGLLHADVVSVLQDISHGLIRPTVVIPGAVGLAALRFDIRDIQAHQTKQVTEPMLRISDLVTHAGWKRDDIKEWIQGGFLRVHREQHDQQTVERIPLSALTEFLTRYIVLSDVSDALSTTTNYLLTTFKPAKIQPAVSAITGQPPARGLLVEKLAVVRGAQLRKPLIREFSELLEGCP